MSEQLISQLCMTFDSMSTTNNSVLLQAETYLKQVTTLIKPLADPRMRGNRAESSLHCNSRRGGKPHLA